MREAIVLAGGFGTRLRQEVPGVPKPMAPIGGRPFLEILLSSFATKKFERVVLSVGFMCQTIIDFFGRDFRGMEIVYEVEESPLGTGGAIRGAMTRCVSEQVFVINGDSYLDFDPTIIEELWDHRRRPIMVVCQVADASRYGRVAVRDSRVTGFSEKGRPGPGLINAGCYFFPRSILNDYPVGKAFSLEVDFLPKAVAEGSIDALVTNTQFIDIGVPEDYRRAQQELTHIQ